MFKDLCIIIGLLFLLSCSSASKLRRAEKLIKKAEELGAKWHIDTVMAQVSYPIPEIYIKEVHHAPIHDTVRVEKDRLKNQVCTFTGG